MTVIQQGNTKGYDLDRIREFLDHLILESPESSSSTIK